MFNSRNISASILLAAVGVASPAFASFSYTDFSSTAGLKFNGVATPYQNAISVTPPVARSAGSFWNTTMQDVGMGFQTDFSYRIRDKSGIGSDGFAFVIQNSFAQQAGVGGSGGSTTNTGIDALGAGGGALGYASNLAFPSAGVGINNSLAFEFDMYNNQADWSDFNSDNHLSVHTMGALANQPNTATSLAHYIPPSGPFQDLSDGGIYDVRIVYSSGIMNLFMKKQADASFGSALMSFNVNLSSIMTLGGDAGNQAFVGFTAGTGGAANVERHEILNWSFAGQQVPAPGAAALVAAGGVLLVTRRRR